MSEMRSRVLGTFLAICISHVGATPRWFTGVYRNSALGFAVKIPSGLKGLTGDQDGPERGVRIVLPSSGHIVVFGEPNSFEWGKPEDGVRAVLEQEACGSGKPEFSRAHVGRLNGSKGILLCGERVIETLLVFRPGGGPIYWLRLETVREHQSADAVVLANVAASFRVIRWE